MACPNCGSKDLVKEKIWSTTYITCKKCGYRWVRQC